MNSKAYLAIFVFILWSLFSGWVYVCKIKGICFVEVENVMDQSSNGISFKLGESNPVISPNFENYKSSVLTKLDVSNKLRITGIYSAIEVNSSGFENLGTARAIATQSLFDEISQDRFEIFSREEELDTSKENVQGIELAIITKNDFVEETAFGAILHPELDNDSLIPKIDAYLTYIAIEYSSSELSIVGHTDDNGLEGENFTIGLNKANKIMDALIAKGMDPQNLNPSSKGATEPIATNATEDGRKENRRVELLIN